MEKTKYIQYIKGNVTPFTPKAHFWKLLLSNIKDVAWQKEERKKEISVGKG